MCVNKLPRVALDSGEAGIRTRDLLIASPASQPLSRATQKEVKVSNDKVHYSVDVCSGSNVKTVSVHGGQ